MTISTFDVIVIGSRDVTPHAVEDVSTREPHLEDVFLSLTRKVV